MGIKVGLTYDIKPDWVLSKDEPVDQNAEYDKPETIDSIEEALRSASHEVIRIGNFDQLRKKIDSLEIDIVFNVCEGKVGRNRESAVPNFLEALNIPYVGADPLSLGVTLDKAMAKRLFQSNNVPTASFISVKPGEEILELDNLHFPLFCKTSYEGSSKGVNEQSRVTNLDELKAAVQRIHCLYNQPALVEEFIKGSEFTAVVLGNQNPQTMPIIQYSIDGKLDLGNDYYTHNRLLEESVEYLCPARISKSLSDRLKSVAIEAYQCVECRDFGRVDFRVDEEEDIYVLEVNPYPSLEKGDSFGFYPKEIGSTYNEEINRILNFALKRHNISVEQNVRVGS